MIERYHRYRSYGHGPLISASLAIPTKPFFIAVIIAALILGAFL